jgi:hypothetical protein
MNLILAALIGPIMLFFPGFAFLSLTKRWVHLPMLERIICAITTSLALIPLCFYFLSSFGLRSNLWFALAFILVSIGITVRDLWKSRAELLEIISPESRLTFILLLTLLLVTLFARLWTVRGLEYPLWTDAYHHTLITQIMVDTGRIPTSYEPYAHLEQFTYHFGFHAMAAWFHWLTGISVPTSVLLFGQIVNWASVPAAYLLAWCLFKSRRAGLVAGLIVGCLSHMPALYVNWSRYPQLAGQGLLPVSILLAKSALDQDQMEEYAPYVIAGIAAAGLFLVHSRIFLFYLLFVGIYFLYRILQIRKDPIRIRRLILSIALLSIVFLAIDSYWLINFTKGFGVPVAKEVLAGYQPDQYGSYFDFDLAAATNYGMHAIFLILALFGLTWGVLRRNPMIGIIIFWLFGLFLAANTHRLGITPFFSNLIVIIFLYLPLSAVIGYLFDQLGSMTEIHFFHSSLTKGKPGLGVLFLFLCVMILAVPSTIRLIEPENGFVRQADLEAMEWIRNNVPEDALFFIQLQFWTPIVAHGLDAGYWIPYLAGRETILPPQNYPSDGSTEMVSLVNQRAEALSEAADPESLWDVMRYYSITHVYIGKRHTDLQPGFFLARPDRFKSIYSRDDVWIFEMIPQ